MSSCSACSQLISVTDRLICSHCSRNYHYICVNYNKENFSKVSTRAKSSWKCPECKQPRRKGDNSETPVKEILDNVSESDHVQSAPSSFQVFDERLAQFEVSMFAKIDNIIADSISKHFKDQFKDDFESFRKDMKLISELTKSVEFMSSKFDEINKELSELRSETVVLRAENAHLRENVTELNTKMSLMEQRARENNIEVHCIPEHSNENLVNSILQLTKVVGCPIEEREILACSRVSRINTKSTRPRSTIVKLASPRVRDSVLAAYYKYNKLNPSHKLSSSDLGIGGDKQPIYLMEHLSPNNRELHAQARIFKKDNQYKYVWVRNGRVMLRKDDSSTAVWVKNAEILKKLSNK